MQNIRCGLLLHGYIDRHSVVCVSVCLCLQLVTTVSPTTTDEPINMTLSRGAWRCMSQGPHGCVQHCYLWRLRSSNTSSRRRDRDRDAGTELCVNELTGADCSGVAGVARYCRVSDLSPLFYMDGRVCMRARCHQSPSTTDDAVARGCRPLTIYTRLTRTYRLGARLHILTASAGFVAEVVDHGNSRSIGYVGH